jgi:hypothetical protein
LSPNIAFLSPNLPFHHRTVPEIVEINQARKADFLTDTQSSCLKTGSELRLEAEGGRLGLLHLKILKNPSLEFSLWLHAASTFKIMKIQIYRYFPIFKIMRRYALIK